MSNERLRQLEAMAFDLDDTGVRSGDRLRTYHRQTLARLAISPMPSVRGIDHVVGDPRGHVFQGLYPEERIEEAKAVFDEVAKNDPYPSRSIPGVPRALGRLVRKAGVPYGWVADCTRQTEYAIRCGGISPDDAAFIYDGKFGSKAERVKRAIDQLGVAPQNFGMGGGTDVDMIAAEEVDPEILKVGILKHAAEPKALTRASDITFNELHEFVEAVILAKEN